MITDTQGNDEDTEASDDIQTGLRIGFCTYGNSMELTDIHCHIVPYVDDGAEDLNESLELLSIMYVQNVRNICATVHLRGGMFETSDETLLEQFLIVKEAAEERFPGLSLYLSREYHCDETFYDLLAKGTLIPYGSGNILLTEFSSRHTASYIFKYTQYIIARGYIPLIAHAERCRALRDDIKLIGKLKDAGALIQLNADSILGIEGTTERGFCKKLLKEKMADVVASDAHDPTYRPPRLLECAQWLERKFGAAYTEKLIYDNPEYILHGK